MRGCGRGKEVRGVNDGWERNGGRNTIEGEPQDFPSLLH